MILYLEEKLFRCNQLSFETYAGFVKVGMNRSLSLLCPSLDKMAKTLSIFILILKNFSPG